MIAVAIVEYQGQKYKLIEPGYWENDTNVWIETGDVRIVCLDTGEEDFSDDLFSVLMELAESKWKLEYEED